MTRALVAAFLLSGGAVQGADFAIDPGHSFVRFKIQHLGYSWMWGGFNDLAGSFSYDAAKPGDASIDLTIQTASVDTNHAERDKHLRSDDFLDVQKYPRATFKATRFSPKGAGGTLEGDLTLRGVTKPLELSVTLNKIANYPFGHQAETVGFSARGTVKRSEFGMDYAVANGFVGDDVDVIIEVEANQQQ